MLSRDAVLRPYSVHGYSVCVAQVAIGLVQSRTAEQAATALRSDGAMGLVRWGLAPAALHGCTARLHGCAGAVA